MLSFFNENYFQNDLFKTESVIASLALHKTALPDGAHVQKEGTIMTTVT